MLDLDRFKGINDARGHEAGDEVLRVVSARMRNALRDGDLLGRWGGEEFVAVLPATTAAQAVMVGDRIRAAISSPIAMAIGEDVSITASVGCATTMHETADQVIARADRAMYLAKVSGDATVLAPQPPDHGGPRDPSHEGRRRTRRIRRPPTGHYAGLPVRPARV